MKIVIKIGTHALLTETGYLNQDVINNLVYQIATLNQQNHSVILVTSGAVACGRIRARESLGCEFGSTVADKQVLATLGQPALMRIYAKAFEQYNLLTAQLLLSHNDFKTREHHLNIQQMLDRTLMQKNIIPIVNGNDSVMTEGLIHSFTDNDELAGILAMQINADKLILLTNVPGVFDKDPHDPDAELIDTIYLDDDLPVISDKKSDHGSGGMTSKLNTARNASMMGVVTHIARAMTPNIVLDIMEGKHAGTTILPHSKESSKKHLPVLNLQEVQDHLPIEQQ